MVINHSYLYIIFFAPRGRVINNNCIKLNGIEREKIRNTCVYILDSADSTLRIWTLQNYEQFGRLQK